MTKARGKRGQDEADVRAAREVIGNDQNRAAQILEVFAPDDAWVRENLRCGTDQRVVDAASEPTHGLALRPPRVGVSGAAGGGVADKKLHVGEGSCFGEGGFV